MIWALHGAVGDPSDWDFLQKDFPSTNAIDLYQSVLPYQLWAEQFCTTVREADPAPVLLGYSMGGRLALHAWLHSPELWQKVIIISAHPGLESEAERQQRIKSDLIWARKIEENPWDEFWKEWNSQAIFRSHQHATTTLNRANLAVKSQAIAQGFREWSLGKQAPLTEAIRAINPSAEQLIWITGALDQKFIDLSKNLPIPTPSRAIIPNAGHRVPWDAPDHFLQILREQNQGHNL